MKTDLRYRVFFIHTSKDKINFELRASFDLFDDASCYMDCQRCEGEYYESFILLDSKDGGEPQVKHDS